MNQQPEALRIAAGLSASPECTCAAWSANECACDAVWPEHFVTEAAAELRRLHEENEALRKDAERYRWLKSVKHLELNTTNGEWIREDDSRFISSHRLCAFGTAFAPYPTLDETIDAAMG